MNDESEVTIGVLALQGAFAEHVNFMKRLGCKVKEVRSTTYHFVVIGLILLASLLDS
jgi:glutamine amidotransferase PdxT